MKASDLQVSDFRQHMASDRSGIKVNIFSMKHGYFNGVKCIDTVICFLIKVKVKIQQVAS